MSIVQVATEPTVCKEVATDIYQVRLPLPFALNHVNCYLLRDADGWTIVDTGLNRPEVQAVWQAAWSKLGITPRQIRRIILTHLHPDHFGLAGTLQRMTNAPVLLSPRELEHIESVWAEGAWGSETAEAYWRRGGVPASLTTVIREQSERLRLMTLPHAQMTIPITPGMALTLAGRTFQAILAPGHSDGQLVFYAAKEHLMLCGDQVLMKITPNIGLWPATLADPLGRYLQSLRALAELDVQTALPGHGALIPDWMGRIGELQAHHAARLTRMLESIGAGATAFEVAQRVFNFAQFSEHEIRFAVAETLAHLEYLVLQGELRHTEDTAQRYCVN